MQVSQVNLDRGVFEEETVLNCCFMNWWNEVDQLNCELTFKANLNLEL